MSNVGSQSSSNTLALNSNTEAAANWSRYMYGRNRGHDDYCERAAYLERMYLPGHQWSDEDKEAYPDRDLHELNEIFPGVNSAVGYQIHNRMDIAFSPRSGQADEEKAVMRSKIAMQIADNNMLHWKETDVFLDGLIEQRGYFDLRIRYDDSVLGELAIDILDPRDVIPDPDAKTYSPDDGWNDVIVTRWMTLDDIENIFGLETRQSVEAFRPSESDFGMDDQSGERSRFGDNDNLNSYSEYDAWRDDAGIVHVRVIDRQKYKWAVRDVGIYPAGDIRPVNPEQIGQLIADGVVIEQRRIKIVERIISTKDMMLFKGDSELPFFSVIPFFPYFRRGKTVGMVDNGASAQEIYNKMVTQYIHVINSTANSGWIVEEDSLTNMDIEELSDTGASTGLVVEIKKGARPPQKIQPNQVPSGVDRMIERSMGAVRDATTPEAMRGTNGQEVSGVAIQSKQFASQQQLAIALDNLSRTRHIMAKRIDWVLTNVYDSMRIFRITGTDPVTGRKNTEELAINQPMPDGSYYNDMTAGEYDVVISEQPMQVTFENSQFTQALEMREKGVAIDDKIVVRYSNLADKHDIIDQMIQREQSAGQINPLDQAKVDYMAAQTKRENAMVDKVIADTAGVNVKAQFEAIQTGAQVLLNPGIVPVSDELLMSAGYKDHNGAPLVNQPVQQAVIDNIPQNTSPQFPPNPPQPEQMAEIMPEQMAKPDVQASPAAGIETTINEQI